MRKKIHIVLAAGAMLATPAFAASNPYYSGPGDVGPEGAEVVTGAAAGTAVGLGLSEGWFGAAPAVAGAALPATAAGAAAVGGVAGIGAVAFIDAALEPCRGFHALFDLSHGACVNGQYVGYEPQPVPHRRHRR